MNCNRYCYYQAYPLEQAPFPLLRLWRARPKPQKQPSSAPQEKTCTTAELLLRHALRLDRLRLWRARPKPQKRQPSSAPHDHEKACTTAEQNSSFGMLSGSTAAWHGCRACGAPSAFALALGGRLRLVGHRAFAVGPLHDDRVRPGPRHEERPGACHRELKAPLTARDVPGQVDGNRIPQGPGSGRHTDDSDLCPRRRHPHLRVGRVQQSRPAGHD